jgi:hypothetical protein
VKATLTIDGDLSRRSRSSLTLKEDQGRVCEARSVVV